ncbi:MAG: response regulator [Actinomycetota bacterium]|nr:response regulator [Actinomycetota bacterium]
MATKQRVLIVEDDRDVAKIIAVNLKLEGMEVVQAFNGEDALRLLDEEKPDCVVLDIMLPGISGWEILKRLKDDPETRNIPVVMVTAKVSDKDRLRGLEGGALKYITKPFNPMVLVEEIKDVLLPQAKDEMDRSRREVVERLQLSVLQKISSIIISSGEMEELLKLFASEILELLEIDACGVVLSSKEPPLSLTFTRAMVGGKYATSSASKIISPETNEQLRAMFPSPRTSLRGSEIRGLEPEKITPFTPEKGEIHFIGLFDNEDKYQGVLLLSGPRDLLSSETETSFWSTIASRLACGISRIQANESLKNEVSKLRAALRDQDSKMLEIASAIDENATRALRALSHEIGALKGELEPDINPELSKKIQAAEQKLDSVIKQTEELHRKLATRSW